MKPLDEKALEAGAAVEAEWDGRDFAALGRADKQRYRDRFGDGVRAYMAALDPAPGEMMLPLETAGPYEARYCKGLPTDCCDYGIISLSEGREVCRVWRAQDAWAIAALLPAAPMSQES